MQEYVNHIAGGMLSTCKENICYIAKPCWEIGQSFEASLWEGKLVITNILNDYWSNYLIRLSEDLGRCYPPRPITCSPICRIRHILAAPLHSIIAKYSLYIIYSFPGLLRTNLITSSQLACCSTHKCNNQPWKVTLTINVIKVNHKCNTQRKCNKNQP